MATTVDTSHETVSLIGSDKVDGTAVYGADDRKIGSVQRVMIDKISGKVSLCGGLVRRISRHGRGLLSDAVAQPEIRHSFGWLPRWRD